jgi:hypothetical protein
MIQHQLKLKITSRQERQLNHWLYHLAAVWNWAVKKIEHDAEGGICYTSLRFRDLLNSHGAKIGVPQDAICGTLVTAPSLPNREAVLREVEEIQKLYEASTQGDWFTGDMLKHVVYSHTDGMKVCQCENPEHDPDENAKFIAAIHNAWPRLIEMLRSVIGETK